MFLKVQQVGVNGHFAGVWYIDLDKITAAFRNLDEGCSDRSLGVMLEGCSQSVSVADPAAQQIILAEIEKRLLPPR